MVNISSASGKITLKGDWTQEAIDAFEPVLDVWGFMANMVFKIAVVLMKNI